MTSMTDIMAEPTQIVDILKNQVANAIIHRKIVSLGEFCGIIEVPTQVINKHIFHIHDCKADGLIECSQNSADRAATYKNGTPEAPNNLLFIKYEEFVNQFNKSNKCDWSKGLSRVDFIVVTKEFPKHFLMHEVSIGNINSKKADARNQFIRTLDFLLKVPEMKECINQFEIKRCLVSARGCDDIKPTPRGMADGFGRPYKLIPNPSEVRIPVINKVGFTIWKGNIIDVE